MREERAMNLEETRPQPHIVLVNGRVHVFHGERMGRDPFRHCLRQGREQGCKGGAHSLGKTLAADSILVLEETFSASRDTCPHPGGLTPGTPISIGDQLSGCHIHFNVAPPFLRMT